MTGQASLLQSLGWAVLNSLWQLALLWVAYQLITGIFRNLRAGTRSSLASGLLIGGFAWFIYTFAITYASRNADQALISSNFVNADGNYRLNQWLEQTLPVASIAYLVLLVLPILHFIRNYRYVQVIRKYGLTRMNVEWRLFVNRVAAQMNIKKTVKIWASEFVSSPVTVGFLKPVILVPIAAINHLTPQQLEAVLLHELSHIRRFDYLVNLVINFIQAVLYFNPFVKAFVKIVEREREKSCDEMVLQFQYDSHDYATALLILEKANHSEKPLAIPSGGKRTDLLHRVELIMGVHKKPFLSFNKLAGLMAGLLSVIALNALLLFSKPADANRISFAHFNSPVNVEATASPVLPLKVIETPSRIVNHAVEAVAKTKHPSNKVPLEYLEAATDPAFINVSAAIPEPSPELKKYQEEQVERTVQASKKILASVQWKVVERNIAEVLNQKEKELLKDKYEREIAQIDWKRIERQLKQAYGNIDWENMNAQLATAASQLRMDSLQRVYSVAASKMDAAAKELKKYEMEGIPDTDISLKEIEHRQADLLKALNDLKKLRSKKIVHL